MKLEKAIEILEDLQTTLPQYPPEDRRDAVRLAIEALKRFQHYRRDTVNSILDPLPGEREKSTRTKQERGPSSISHSRDN